MKSSENATAIHIYIKCIFTSWLSHCRLIYETVNRIECCFAQYMYRLCFVPLSIALTLDRILLEGISKTRANQTENTKWKTVDDWESCIFHVGILTFFEYRSTSWMVTTCIGNSIEHLHHINIIACSRAPNRKLQVKPPSTNTVKRAFNCLFVLLVDSVFFSVVEPNSVAMQFYHRTQIRTLFGLLKCLNESVFGHMLYYLPVTQLKST